MVEGKDNEIWIYQTGGKIIVSKGETIITLSNREKLLSISASVISWEANFESKSCSNFLFANGKSEEILVRGIKAHCSAHPHWIEEGVVIGDINSTEILFPLCGVSANHLAYANRVRYSFKITEDGQVLFSQL